nr:unnamed protein product [Callosobruchus chinensis]
MHHVHHDADQHPFNGPYGQKNAPSLRPGRHVHLLHLHHHLLPHQGNDRLDVLSVGGVHAVLRKVLRRGAWQHPVDDHRRAVLPGPQARRHEHRRAGQLDRQLRRRYRLPQHEGEYFTVQYACFYYFQLFNLHIGDSINP